MATTWVPFSTRLRDELAALETLAMDLLDVSQIEDRRMFNSGGALVFIAPDYAWVDPTTEVRRRQIALIHRLDRWVERLTMLFRDAPEELRAKLEEATGTIRAWIAREGDDWSRWDLPPTIAAAKPVLAGQFDEVLALFDVMVPAAQDSAIALPDTGALLDVPDFTRYPAQLGVSAAEIVLVPAVLSELDNLKDQGRTQDVRDKARAAGVAIKALRQRGHLLDGVIVAPGVTVRSRPTEPDFHGLPGSLNPAVPDDRVLASAFELQRERPNAAVVLVTGDVNLQTKAELYELPFVEPPA